MAVDNKKQTSYLSSVCILCIICKHLYLGHGESKVLTRSDFDSDRDFTVPHTFITGSVIG